MKIRKLIVKKGLFDFHLCSQQALPSMKSYINARLSNSTGENFMRCSEAFSKNVVTAAVYYQI